MRRLFVTPAKERVKESDFCIWRGLKSLSLACGEGGSGGEGRRVMTW
jgi:hypothetical protein